MKNKINILLLSCLFIVLSSCEDTLEKSVSLDIAVTTPTGTLSGNSFSVHTGEPVTFHFTGDPDFITFFSGENGHEYSKVNLFEIPVSEITSTLKFTAKPQYGVVTNTLKVFLSTNFTGLRGLPVTNKQTDSLAIVKEKWIDITDACGLPTASNATSNAEIALKDYLGKKLTLAFRYKPEQNAAVQPTWIITNLRIENQTATAVSVLPASIMGFKALDMFSSNTYKNDGGAGVWDLRNIARTTSDPEIRIASSPAGSPMNEDWLISNPIVINSRPGDKGIAIKKVSDDFPAYTHTFEKAGTYTVTFIARNENYKASSEVIRQFEITVK